MSKYINDYFEKKKQTTQNQKNKKKLINQNYESGKIKKILIQKNNKNISSIKNLEYLKKNFNDININNLNNIYMEILNSINKNINNIMEEKYKKIVKRILNMTQENIYKKDNNSTTNCKKRIINKSMSASIFKNNSLCVSKNGKNITLHNILFHINREKSIPRENLSIKSTSHSRKIFKDNSHKKFLALSKSNDNILKKEGKIEEAPCPKFFPGKYENFHIFKKPSSSTKSFFRNQYIDSSKKIKEKYIKDRVKYIIKNTRILFTKSKNLDKIVRIKNINSTL